MMCRETPASLHLTDTASNGRTDETTQAKSYQPRL